MRLIGPLFEGQFLSNSNLKARTGWLKLTGSSGRVGLPFLVGGVILVLAWLIGLGRDSFLIDFGADNRLDLVYIQTEEGGFFNPEKQQGETPFPNYDNNYRWTGRISYINLPWPLDATPLKATLRATAPRPDRSPDESGTTLTISGLLNNSSIDLGKYPLTGLYDGTELTFRLPGHLRPTLERFRLRFESSETWQPSKSDTRNLSALFFSLKLEPDYVAFGWQDWLASWVQPGLLALLTFTTWGLAGLFTSRQGWRLALEIMAGLLLLISLFGWPQAAEPFYTPWALILLAAWGLLWLAGRFADQAPCLPAPFVYAATLLPGLPLAQLIFGRLELTSLSNGSVSIALYFGALLVSLVGYLWLRHKFELIFSGAFLLAAALIFIYTHWQVYAFNLYRGADFRNYYLALLDLEQYHTPLYSLEEMATLPGQAVRSAPIFAVLFWPLARLFGRDINMALLFWRVSNELLLLPTLLIFGQVFGRFRAGLKLWPAMLFLVLSFGQLAETAAYGQQNFMLLFGLALLALWVKQHRDTLGGMALSLPIWVKLLPGISVAFFLIERRWRGLVGLVLGALLVNVLTVAVVGWDNVWFYFSKAMWSVNEPELGISNQSWWGFIGRLGVHEVKGDFVGGYPTHLAPLGYLGALLGVGLTLLILWRARGGDWLHDQLKLGALALVGLWVPPFSWMHYIVLGLVAIMALLVVLSREGTPRSHLIIFALAYVLLAYGGLQEFFFTQAAGLALLGSSYRFLATFALWVLSLWLLWQPSYKSLVAPSI